MDNTAIQQIKDAIGKSQSIGIAAPKNPTMDEMAAALSLYLLLKNANKNVSISYLYYAFRYIEKNELKKHLKQSVHQHFGVGEAKKMPIIIPVKDGKPSLSRQEKIAREFEKIENIGNELQKKYQEQINNFNELKQSILNQAFQGKL